MTTPFWHGFEKTASDAATRARKIGKHLSVVGRKGDKSLKSSLDTYRATGASENELFRLKIRLEQAKARNGGREAMLGGVATGGKAYVNAAGPNLRRTAHHEMFHARVPIIGRSEYLAHAYGGLRGTKGKLDLKAAKEQVNHFAKIRPDEARTERRVAAGVAGTALLGGAVLAHGREKKAGESPIDDWLAQAKDESKKAKVVKPLRVDPRELSEWRGPDAWPRTWP